MENKRILIGSKALLHHFPDLGRVPKDTDYAVKTEERSEENGVEFLYNPEFDYSLDRSVATPEELMTLKLSHLFWDKDFDKHMWDYHFLKGKGIKVNLELYRRFRVFFEDYLPKVRRSNLELSKDEFFTNSVNEDVDEHDKLHLVIADTPAYTKILKDGCEVEVCENKFNSLSFGEKVDVVVEEAIIMSFERYSGKIHWTRAFKRQLDQNIQKHYPEFIALFAIDNYPMFLDYKKLTKIEENFKKLKYECKRV